MDIFGEIHASGNTVVLVTHEEDIARHALRIIRLRDGRIDDQSADSKPAVDNSPLV
jgi:putative ABC transport system ATP-binding protein